MKYIKIKVLTAVAAMVAYINFMRFLDSLSDIPFLILAALVIFIGDFFIFYTWANYYIGK